MRLLDARLDLDSGCNYRCIYCQNRRAEQGGATYYPVDKLLTVLPALGKFCWSVYLSCGGEPTLHPDFDKILRVHVPRLLPETDVFLVTNGFRLNKSVCDAIVESGITRVNISVDTMDAENYGRLCGCAPTALEVVLGNVETLIRARGKKKYPKIFLTSVAMKSTIEKMPDVCAWVARTGLDGHRIQFITPYDTEGMLEEDIAGAAHTRAALTECKSVLSKGGVYWDIPLAFADKLESMAKGALLVKNKAEYLLSSAKKLWATIQKPNCRLAGQIIRVDSDGYAEFCKQGGIQPGNLFGGSSGVTPERRVKNAYNSMRNDNMSACSAECPYLIR